MTAELWEEAADVLQVFETLPSRLVESERKGKALPCRVPGQILKWGSSRQRTAERAKRT